MPRGVQGIVLVLLATSLWGLSGTAAQLLFTHFGFSPLFLVVVRLWGASLLLLLAIGVRQPRSLRVSARDLGGLAVFGALGFFLVQFSYFAAIALVGVAMATFLQYLGPPLIAAWFVVTQRRPPARAESVALSLAILGTVLLVLGQGGVRLQPLGIVFGLLSAFSLAFYTIFPHDLIRRHGPFTTTAFGFLFGAVVATLPFPLWQHGIGRLTTGSLLLIAFVVVLGTLVPFALYVFSLTRLRPTAVGIAATAEPLSAAISAFLVLGQALRWPQYLGGALILGAMIALARESGRSAAGEAEPTPVAAGGRPDC